MNCSLSSGNINASRRKYRWRFIIAGRRGGRGGISSTQSRCSLHRAAARFYHRRFWHCAAHGASHGMAAGDAGIMWAIFAWRGGRKAAAAAS
jgi:hypothetical protein